MKIVREVGQSIKHPPRCPPHSSLPAEAAAAVHWQNGGKLIGGWPEFLEQINESANTHCTVTMRPLQLPLCFLMWGPYRGPWNFGWMAFLCIDRSGCEGVD